MAIKLGITGGIGSGKSLVCHLLEIMGVPIYISDAETKQLMLTDTCIREGLISLLGDEAYVGESLNKPLLASYLFASKEHASCMNAIIHPRVKEDFRRWADVHRHAPIVAIESAILIESGFAGEVDAIVMVYAPEDVRISRAMKRDDASREQIESRIRSQMDDEAKRRGSHYVILNDGKTPLIPQVLSLLELVTSNNVLPLSAE